MFWQIGNRQMPEEVLSGSINQCFQFLRKKFIHVGRFINECVCVCVRGGYLKRKRVREKGEKEKKGENIFKSREKVIEKRTKKSGRKKNENKNA